MGDEGAGNRSWAFGEFEGKFHRKIKIWCFKIFFFQISKKSSEKAKKQFESEIAELKEKTKSNDFPSRKIQELQDKIKDLEHNLDVEFKRNTESNSRYELLEEEHVLFKAQLTTENEKLHVEIKNLKAQITKFTQNESTSQSEVKELKTKIQDLQRKLTEAELVGSKTTSSFDLEKSRLKSKLDDTEIEFNKLQRQNEMNLDQISSLRKDVSHSNIFFYDKFLMTF